MGYVFRFCKKILLSMVNSWGKCLLKAFVSPLTVRKCAQICFVSLELETDSVKYLRFAALIDCLVLFLFILYSVHCFSRLLLSRAFCICTMFWVNQSGIRLVLTRLVLMGPCLFKCFNIMEDHMAISSSIDSLSGTKVSRSFDSSASKLFSLKCLKHR